jgi:hypothetical protein
MAISSADFYAYSRATGAPIPEDPAERMQMAPEVMEFRRNQLKAPSQERQQGPDLLSLGIGAGLALAGGAGAFLGARRLMRGPKQSATAGVQTANLAEMAAESSPVRRVVQESQPAPSRVAPQVGEQEFVAYRPDPKEMVSRQVADARRQSATESLLKAAESRRETYQPDIPGTQATLMALRSPLAGESAGVVEAAAPSRSLSIAPQQQSLFSPRSYIEQSGAVAPAEDLTSLQQRNLSQVVDQNINAVESGEDQITGRVVKQANAADLWGEATVPPTVINEQSPTLLLPPQATSLREDAQSFLQKKFEELGDKIPGRYRRERALGQDPQIAEAMELYASTGDPSVLSRLSEAPSSPLTVTPRIQTEIKDAETIPTRMFYRPTGKGEFIGDLDEKDINLTNRISKLGLAKQNTLQRLKEIDELEPQLRFAGADEPGQGGYYTRMLNSVLSEKQKLNPEAFNADINDALAERNFVRSQIDSAKALGSKYDLIPRQEGVRPFFEVNPATNEPIAETLEIRSGRPAVQLEEKSGGGRNYAMYDPESQTGSSIGIYGVEPRNYPIADPELRPTALQRQETRVPLRRMPTEGPALKTYIEETKRARAATPETKQRSLEVSEAMRRARIEGRDPNMVLRNFGFNL